MAERKIGRPTLYDEKYGDDLIDHMSQGLSFDTFAGTIGTCRDTLYEWVNRYPEFSDAKRRATAKRNLFVETMYINAAMGRPIRDKKGELLKPNMIGMIYWTKNTLGWKDKVEQSFDGDSAPVFTLNYKLDE